MSFATFSLQSGSNGNSIYVEAGGVRLLFDAGISGRLAELRMASHNRHIRAVDALIISHDHGDHVSCAGVYQRRFGLPIYMTRATARASRSGLGPVTDVREFQVGQTLEFDDVRVHTLPTPHDAADGAAFVVEWRGRRLGIFTDLGHPFAALRDWLRSVHAAYLESNYDPRMLESGTYPPDVKARISGPGGHLSNVEAADLLAGRGLDNLKWIALAHLSERNNSPELALETHRARVGPEFPIEIAGRCEASPLLIV